MTHAAVECAAIIRRKLAGKLGRVVMVFVCLSMVYSEQAFSLILVFTKVKQVHWEVDPLLCPKCNHEMRIVSLINDAHVIERILRHVGMWVNELCNHGRRIAPSTGPLATGIIERGQLVIEPWLDDPMPDCDCGV